MTEFDYVVLVILISSVIIGTLRGLVKEILSLISWVVAFVVANAYGAQLAPMLSVIPGETVRLMVAFVALFLGTRILMGLVMMAVDLMVKATGLSPANRLLGATFGLARGVVIVLAAVILCGMTDLPKQAFWTKAVSSPMAEEGARMVKTLLPADLARHVQF
ncbi:MULTISPECIES: CvpA family protein [Massilia]|uniref:CvpA family protein n=1 Tax=Massilia TaxID=149698 RepID=UPI0027969951|nr:MULTISPECIES: CvpA family protein [unclassified Massilia]MDQ1815911.1 CvpA family protein [Massilia sp. CCM 9210]MDQ1834496.1 CvpA family protein [Massilia sp. CCM 9029]MDQ1923646.1 CvpA family protein [Massilia sp. CCM 9206]